MRPPLTNATLTKVEGGGGVDDSGIEIGDVEKWAGESPCYVEERMARAADTTLHRDTSVDIDAALTEPVSGDNITFTYRGVQYRRKVRDLKPYMLLDATTGWRLYLERD